MSKDYYNTLGVGKDASASEIKKAYRKLAKEYHPDKTKGDKTKADKFREISEAYDVLSDDGKRQSYDRYGTADPNQGAGGFGGFGQGRAGGHGNAEDFEEMFGSIFRDFMGGGSSRGRRNTRNHKQRGSDLSYELSVTLEEVYRGDKKDISFRTYVGCDSCDGKGSNSSSGITTCSTCGGHGVIAETQGFFTVERTCPTCGGQGIQIKDPCRKCSGSGRVIKNKELSIKIPPGADNGIRIRIANEGEAGVRGGPNGDLFISVNLKKHPFFQRQGNDLLCKAPIKMTTAALGGEIEIPCLDGSVATVKIAPGTQNDTKLKLSGKGMPSLKRSNTFGNLLVQVGIEIPVNLTPRQKELLVEFEKECKNNSPKTDGFFDRIKKMFS